jgi:hypothetical protein
VGISEAGDGVVVAAALVRRRWKRGSGGGEA